MLQAAIVRIWRQGIGFADSSEEIGPDATGDDGEDFDTKGLDFKTQNFREILECGFGGAVDAFLGGKVYC